MLWLAGGSLLILAGLAYLLYRESQPAANTSTDRPLKVYCAAALKLTMQTIAAEFEKETGRRVEFEFGDGSTQQLGPGGLAWVDAPTERKVRNLSDSEDAVYVVVGGKDGYVGRDGKLSEGETHR